ncbi:hypothetical protein [Streptomyces ureilyticus]|uniref:Uncharacterized protein n=1 Tax=Streptomyces ureilyticus TaxID=1775131 RepID=A0ABX0DFK6_9ACTN|nr:hypothetical protein [Streptomyces ureilyticus]NGO40646.1 hypothetical protein [Streptomyces ureilyticus]
MTDDPIPRPATLSPKDEARVSFALGARKLGDLAYDLIPLDPDAPPGDRLRRALALRERLDALVVRAVIAEREEGTSWEQIGRAAGGITKQAAHERWADHVNGWAAQGRTALGGTSGLSALDAAVSLDATHHRRDPENHPEHAFSLGLDAVRFPGAEAAAQARRERAAGLRARLVVLQNQLAAAEAVFRDLTDQRAAPADRAEALHRQADLREETAALYDQLSELEPGELAGVHRTRAELGRAAAAADREYAELLAPGKENAP